MRTTSWNSSVSSALLGVVSLLLVRSAHALPARPGLEAGSVAAASPTAKEPLDRETPRRTVQGFLREARNGNFRVSADYLDLRAIPAATRNAEAPDLAQKLAYILQRQPTLDLSAVPDVPEGDPKTPGLVVADTLYAGEEPVPIELKREHFPDSVDRWLIDQKTVELIPMLLSRPAPAAERRLRRR